MTNKTIVLEKAVDDANLQLQSSAQFGTAADQRSTAMASAMLQLSAVLTAAFFGWLDNYTPKPFDLCLATLGLAGVYLSTLLFTLAALPVTFFGAGAPPKTWKWHIKKAHDYETALEMRLDEYEVNLSANKNVCMKAVKLFKFGLWTGFASPLIVGTLFMVRYVWSHYTILAN